MTVTITATNVIDMLADKVFDTVTEVNEGRNLTKKQFADAFERAFAVALPTFLDKLENENPDLAAQLRTQYLTEQEPNFN